MLDSRRTWRRRIGTASGVAMVLVGVAIALLLTPDHCQPSTPTRQYACDVGPPTHPHFLLGLLVAALGVCVLVGSRRWFAYFDSTKR
jgi:Na+/H+ antiporter NhaB